MLRPMALILGSLLTTATLAAQTPEIPNAHASDTAKARVAANGAPHRATHVRGVAVGLDNRPVTPATPAVPATRATRATPATPGSGGATPATPAVPATPATPAVPPTPPGKPASPGQSGSHKP